MKKNTRKALILAAKLVVAGVLLWWATRNVNWPSFADALASADWRLVAGSFVCFAVPVFILAGRWWYLLHIIHIHISGWEAVRLTFLGTFFNYVIPGVVSGDFVKAYYAGKHTDRKAAVLVSVFVDRVLGLLEFAIIPAVVIVWMLAAGSEGCDKLGRPAVAVGAGLTAVCVGMALMLSPRLRRLLRLDKIFSKPRIRKHLAVAGQAADLYRQRIGGLLWALVITFFGQMIFIVAIMLAGMALSLPVPWYQYLLYVPLIYIIAAALPISPGGLGVTETFYVTFFSVAAGADASQVLALALIARVAPMLCSAPGLWVAIRGPSLPPAEQIEAELTDSSPS